jgi:hypothetical protein
MHWPINVTYLVKSALISWIFLNLKENEQIVNDFWQLFTINNEQIEPNFNSVFVNKYDKILKYNDDREISSISENFWIVRSHF